jgi:hypothetical protein
VLVQLPPWRAPLPTAFAGSFGTTRFSPLQETAFTFTKFVYAVILSANDNMSPGREALTWHVVPAQLAMKIA